MSFERNFGMPQSTEIPDENTEQRSVYKNMKEDPAYKDHVVDFEQGVFGYTMGEEVDGKIRAIGGETDAVPYLHLEDKVKPIGEYALANLHPDDGDIVIVRLQKPFEKGETDHIVVVKQGHKIIALKPSEVEKVY